jgi:hypothetical protein
MATFAKSGLVATFLKSTSSTFPIFKFSLSQEKNWNSDVLTSICDTMLRGLFWTIRSLPLGVKLAPRGELWPLGGMFTSLITPRGKQSLVLYRNMEGRVEGLHP